MVLEFYFAPFVRALFSFLTGIDNLLKQANLAEIVKQVLGNVALWLDDLPLNCLT